MNANYQTILLESLNKLLNKPKKTLKGACNELKKSYKENTALFEYLPILFEDKNTKNTVDNLNDIVLAEIIKILEPLRKKSYEIFSPFISQKNFNDGQIIEQMQKILLSSIEPNSIILKFFNIIEPLIEDKSPKYRIKIKLYILVPNTYAQLYDELSKEYSLFPKDISDFYAIMNINNYTEMIKGYIDLKKKKNINDGKLDNEQRITVLENTVKKFELQFESLKSDVGRLKANIYKINFRDSIKLFLDDLMSSLNIFNPNSTHSMKIEELTKKINSLTSGLNENEKKCADILLKILEHLKTLNQEGDDLSHYFNNLGFDIKALPDEIKKKYLKYNNNSTNYEPMLLVASSLGDFIKEKEEEAIAEFFKDIKSCKKSQSELIDSIKRYSKLIF